MQPMKPEQKRSALESRPQAQPSDLAEYERLLSERFTTRSRPTTTTRRSTQRSDRCEVGSGGPAQGTTSYFVWGSRGYRRAVAAVTDSQNVFTYAIKPDSCA